jgi:ribonuclease HI
MSNKYYVVFNGRVPGVYNSWKDCKAQVDKFPGAKFKSFKTILETCNAWAEHVNGSPIPERPELAPTLPSKSIEDRGDWVATEDLPQEAKDVLDRIKISGESGGKLNLRKPVSQLPGPVKKDSF